MLKITLIVQFIIVQLFNSEEYHGGFKNSDVHPASDFGDPTEFGDVDPEVNKANTDCDLTELTRVSTWSPPGSGVGGLWRDSLSTPT